MAKMIRRLLWHRGVRGLLLCALPALFAGSHANGSEETAAEGVPVTTKSLADIVFFPARTAPATAVSLNNARVSAEIGGLLNDITVRVGDKVEQGMVVARIDCRDAEADLSQAISAQKANRARNAYEQSLLANAKRLSASKSIASEELDKRRANAQVSGAELDKSKTDLAKARLAVERCTVKAPFNAVVVERLASVGDFVTRGTPIVRLLDTDSTEISARVQEKDLDSIKDVKEAVFESQNERYAVKLRTIVPAMESRLRSYETRFDFTADKAAPGSAGRLRWHSPVPHVPAELVVRRDTLGLFIVDQGRARFMDIPGAQEGKPAPWAGALEGKVIVDGRFSVKDGDPVKVSNP